MHIFNNNKNKQLLDLTNFIQLIMLTLFCKNYLIFINNRNWLAHYRSKIHNNINKIKMNYKISNINQSCKKILLLINKNYNRISSKLLMFRKILKKIYNMIKDTILIIFTLITIYNCNF